MNERDSAIRERGGSLQSKEGMCVVRATRAAGKQVGPTAGTGGDLTGPAVVSSCVFLGVSTGSYFVRIVLIFSKPGLFYTPSPTSHRVKAVFPPSH